MDPNSELQQELLAIFRVELDEQLTLISNGLLGLEKDLSEKDRQEVLNEVFRAAHNIKGAARGLDITTLSEISHHLESLFSMLREDNLNPLPPTIDLCFEAVDAMRQGLQAYEAGDPLDFDLQILLTRLSAEEGDAGPVAAQPAESGTAVEATDEQQGPAESPQPSSTPVEPVPSSASPALQAESEQAAEALEETSEPEKSAEPSASVADKKSEMIQIKTRDLDQVSALIEEIQTVKLELENQADALQQLTLQSTELSKRWGQLALGVKDTSTEVVSDTLLQRVLSDSSDIKDLARQVNKVRLDNHGINRQLDTHLDALQYQVQLLRLVSFAKLLTPLTRSVRDISRQLEKEVDFQTSGEDAEIDRLVLDKLKDPLTHLIRNAIDHGIESPQLRKQAGKPEVGKVTMSLWRDGDHMAIKVEDDGAGIEVDKIVSNAVKKKLIAEKEAEGLSREAILDLIFYSGYSSKDIITDISGRGVGLDVVRSNLNSIKGKIQVDTEIGKGTAFTMRVPLTLATDEGLQVLVGKSIFAIPLKSIDSIIAFTHEDIVDVEAGQAVLIKDQPVPLRLMSEVLELPASEDELSGDLRAVVISSGLRSVALLVDDVIGQREMVIKPLKPPLVSVRNVAGGTPALSGMVILVLSPHALVESAWKSGTSARVIATGQGADESRLPEILVVDDSITTRTLEKSVLENNGYLVTVASDGQQGWDELQNRNFDLVVTDIEMPIMDGFELTERIKQSEKYQNTPVIIVTSLTKDSDKQRGIDVGADAYIVKSQFESKALLEVVRQLL